MNLCTILGPKQTYTNQQQKPHKRLLLQTVKARVKCRILCHFISVRKSRSPDKGIQHFFEIITCDPSIYKFTLLHGKFHLYSNQNKHFGDHLHSDHRFNGQQFCLCQKPACILPILFSFR